MDTLAVTRRFDLTDAQWELLEPLLPQPARSGRPPSWTRRQLVDGIRWRVRTGSPWRDLPAVYGSWAAAYGLFRRWQRNGAWRRVMSVLQALADASGRIVWDVSVDSTVVRAHHHAAGARKKGICKRSPQAECGKNRLITRWAGHEVGGPRNCIWPANKGRSCCRWC